MGSGCYVDKNVDDLVKFNTLILEKNKIFSKFLERTQ